MAKTSYQELISEIEQIISRFEIFDQSKSINQENLRSAISTLHNNISHYSEDLDQIFNQNINELLNVCQLLSENRFLKTKQSDGFIEIAEIESRISSKLKDEIELKKSILEKSSKIEKQNKFIAYFNQSEEKWIELTNHLKNMKSNKKCRKNDFLILQIYFDSYFIALEKLGEKMDLVLSTDLFKIEDLKTFSDEKKNTLKNEINEFLKENKYCSSKITFSEKMQILDILIEMNKKNENEKKFIEEIVDRIFSDFYQSKNTDFELSFENLKNQEIEHSFFLNELFIQSILMIFSNEVLNFSFFTLNSFRITIKIVYLFIDRFIKTYDEQQSKEKNFYDDNCLIFFDNFFTFPFKIMEELKKEDNDTMITKELFEQFEEKETIIYYNNFSDRLKKLEGRCIDFLLLKNIEMLELMLTNAEVIFVEVKKDVSFQNCDQKYRKTYQMSFSQSFESFINNFVVKISGFFKFQNIFLKYLLHFVKKTENFFILNAKRVLLSDSTFFNEFVLDFYKIVKTCFQKAIILMKMNLNDQMQNDFNLFFINSELLVINELQNRLKVQETQQKPSEKPEGKKLEGLFSSLKSKFRTTTTL